jgi:hypothetical protein
VNYGTYENNVRGTVASPLSSTFLSIPSSKIIFAEAVSWVSKLYWLFFDNYIHPYLI